MSTHGTTGRQGPLLEVDDLTVEFDTRAGLVKAVRNVSISVDEGETVALLGESGSGKSVTAQAIMGLLPMRTAKTSSGRVLFDGQDLLSLPVRELRDLCGSELAMVFQDPMSSLNPVMTVGYQLTEGMWRKGNSTRKQARARAIELLDLVGIIEPHTRIDNFPHQFSGGMRQRIMIAMALARSPKLLIADEPTTALDVTVQAQIMSLLSELQKEFGMGLLLISHDLGVVAGAADRVYVMYAGSIVETGVTREVYTQPAHPYTNGLLASIPSEVVPGERLNPIPGNPPLPAVDRVGCSFAPRCRFATGLCLEAEPAPQTPASLPLTRLAACHHSEEVMNHG